MKNNILKYVSLFICFASFLHLNAENKICDNYSDSTWIQWYADSLETNVEISEMRHEYLFCRLESDTSNEFLQFLYFAINENNKVRIEKELQMPINDGIEIRKCIRNVSMSKTDRKFKKWLIRQLDRQDK